MKRAYLLVYSDLVGSRSEIKTIVNAMPEVITWRYDLPNAFYLISEATSQQLAEALRSATGNKGRFIITELADNKYGWLPPDTWYLLREKKHKPKK